MKPHAAELQEGPRAFEQFRRAVMTVLGVPKTALPPRPHRKKKKLAKSKT